MFINTTIVVLLNAVSLCKDLSVLKLWLKIQGDCAFNNIGAL